MDFIGKRFSRLLVIEHAGRKWHSNMWRCLCDCGNEKIVLQSHLVTGHTKSCGCYRVDIASQKIYEKGDIHNTLYVKWGSIKGRCYRKSVKQYKNYGGRGITVCPEWHDFKAFKKWAIATGYKKGDTIDRIDPNGNYCPENCRWATQKQQANNRRNNRYIEFKGERLTAAQWAERLGFSRKAIIKRLDAGYTVEEALTIQKGKGIIKHRVLYNNKECSLSELSKICGVRENVLHYRITHGWDLQDAMFRKVNHYRRNNA